MSEDNRRTVSMHGSISRFLSVMAADVETSISPREIRTRSSFSAWARKRVHIVPKEGGRMVNFELNAIQRIYRTIKLRTRRAGKPRHFLVLKSRRMGITTMEQAESYHLVSTRPSTFVVTMADERDKTEKIFEAVTRMYDADPHRLYGKKGKSGISLAENGSMIDVLTAEGKSPARGLTIHRFHGSEFPYWMQGPNQIEKQRKLLSAVTEAASHGEIVLEATANGSEHFRELWSAARKNQNDWTPIFMPWFMDPRYRYELAPGMGEDSVLDTMNQKEKDLMRIHGVDIHQLLWRRSKVRALGKLFAQEYPEDDESCFLTSGMCYFDQIALLGLLDKIPDYFGGDVEPGVSFKAIEGGYSIEWEPPKANVDYRMGVDTSEGLSHSDPNGYAIVRQDTGEQVASLHGRYDPRRLAEHCVTAAKRYNFALMGVERQNHGHAVLQKVQDLRYFGPRFLFECAPGKAGWSTDAATRPVMISELADAIQEGYMPVRDRQLLSECMTFNKQTDGQYRAGSGAHDDCVMKWAIAWQLRKYARPSLMPIALNAPNSQRR